MNWRYDFLNMDGAYNVITTGIGAAVLTQEEKDKYMTFVHICHDFVAMYLDEYPEVLTMYGQPGYMYFDILEKANPKLYEEATEWAIEFQRRYKERLALEATWSHGYMTRDGFKIVSNKGKSNDM